MVGVAEGVGGAGEVGRPRPPVPTIMGQLPPRQDLHPCFL